MCAEYMVEFCGASEALAVLNGVDLPGHSVFSYV